MKFLAVLQIALAVLFCVPAWSADNWQFSCVDPASPGARFGAEMVYDSYRDTMVLFGRFHSYDPLTTSVDTWTWTPTGWNLAAVSDTPSMTRRGYGSFAFDATRNVAVWYGGYYGDDQTWTWDGAQWTLQNPATHPPASSIGPGYPMAFDLARQVCVLVREDETWEWDGTTWTQVSTSVLPGAPYSSVMAYDSNRQKMVLFASGFYDPNTRTLEYNGVDWELKTPATVVSRHASASMFYDSVRQVIILFGGYLDMSNVCDDTYSWNGIDWTLLTPAQSPPPGAEFACAFHENLGVGVVTNGVYLDAANEIYAFHSDMWAWDGLTWTSMSPGDRPQQRVNASMAWDSARQRLVLFGGTTAINHPHFSDTWEFDGVAWTEMNPVSRPPQFGSDSVGDMAYHVQSALTFLVTPTNPVQTWVWNGIDWAMLSTSPVAGDGNTLIAYNSVDNQMILVSFDSTFLWTGSDWSEIVGAGTPSPPSFSGCDRFDLIFDETLNQYVMPVCHGSIGSLTWLFNGVVWSENGIQLDLLHPRVAWDAGSGKTVAIGGTRGIIWNEAIWEFDGVTWTEKQSIELGGPGPLEHPAVCAHDTGLYCFGGETEWCNYNELWNIEWIRAVPTMNVWGILILTAVVSMMLAFRRK